MVGHGCGRAEPTSTKDVAGPQCAHYLRSSRWCACGVEPLTPDIALGGQRAIGARQDMRSPDPRRAGRQHRRRWPIRPRSPEREVRAEDPRFRQVQEREGPGEFVGRDDGQIVLQGVDEVLHRLADHDDLAVNPLVHDGHPTTVAHWPTAQALSPGGGAGSHGTGQTTKVRMSDQRPSRTVESPVTHRPHPIRDSGP